ncbi:CAP domain-containing protein [Lachnoclostridium sp. Marseille-P6806]|uniref:CAP domain-containing protein n=1 Tax=Lachnoclostridium sp. Marseille-P6806 TaxID=2364793 RepID=UPI0013EF2164|nr:CAP domain-containing protein [Lachnoclostridium sp. Marseille-P6806]
MLIISILAAMLIFFAALIIWNVAHGSAGRADDEAARRKKTKTPGAVTMDSGALTGAVWQSDAYYGAGTAALTLVNEQRAAAGLSQLAWSDPLAQCGLVRSAELPAAFSHTRPDGTDWYTVNSDLMYGENLAMGYNSAAEVVAAWMASPTHRDNILTPGFKTCGIGVIEIGGVWYWSQEFGY